MVRAQRREEADGRAPSSLIRETSPARRTTQTRSCHAVLPHTSCGCLPCLPPSKHRQRQSLQRLVGVCLARIMIGCGAVEMTGQCRPAVTSLASLSRAGLRRYYGSPASLRVGPRFSPAVNCGRARGSRPGRGRVLRSANGFSSVQTGNVILFLHDPGSLEGRTCWPLQRNLQTPLRAGAKRHSSRSRDWWLHRPVSRRPRLESFIFENITPSDTDRCFFEQWISFEQSKNGSPDWSVQDVLPDLFLLGTLGVPTGTGDCGEVKMR